MNIQSSEDAAHLARQIVERDTRITTLVGELRAQDMRGLECAQAVELEELSAENAAAAPILARWFLDQPVPLRLPPPMVRPQISLVLVRPDSAPARAPFSLQVGGNRVTAAMLDAAEDLLHTLTTGEHTLPSDLYEVVARAFGVTRDDAKSRLLRATYGGRGAPMTPGEPST